MRRPKIEYLKCGFNGIKGGGEEFTMSGMIIPRADKFRYYDPSLKRKETLTKILTILLEWDDGNERMLLEYCVIRKF